MMLQGLTPKFVTIERTNDYGDTRKLIVRVDRINYVEVSNRKVYFLDETSVTRVTDDSMKALEKALLDSDEPKRNESPMIQF